MHQFPELSIFKGFQRVSREEINVKVVTIIVQAEIEN